LRRYLKAFLKPVADLDPPILSTLSDKQSALIKALKVIWKDVPHQYCQAHYLSNAVVPLYEADEHMKTQLRQQVRAAAGATMREAQAQAKRNPSNDGPSLIVTGMAVHPQPSWSASRMKRRRPLPHQTRLALLARLLLRQT